MPKKNTFTATIQNAGGGGAFVEIPFDAEKAFGSKKPKVKAMIEGVPYRGLLVRMGSEHHLLLILKFIREQVGKTFGDEIKVSVELDVEERVATVPAELKRVFKSNKDAKKAETRQSRIVKTLALLKKGRQQS